MRELDACPICRSNERTIVMEYNALVLLDKLRDSPLARSDYCVCHACGVVSASRRPEGEDYAFLVENFDENLGRSEDKAHQDPVPTNPDDRRAMLTALRSDDSADVSVAGLSHAEALVRTDRRVNRQHLDALTSALSGRRRPRVLQIRAKAGWLLDELRQRFDAEVYAIPAFARHREVIANLYEIPAQGDVHTERLVVPYDGEFDVIIANHMLTHALFPDELLVTMRERLRPDGLLYLYSENDDHEMWKRRKSLIGEMKCFHMQSFDAPSLQRALTLTRFRVERIEHTKSAISALARGDTDTTFEAMTKRERRKRLAFYRRWRDESVLSLSRERQRLWKGELPEMRRRALACGDAERVREGLRRKVQPRRKMVLSHERGFEALNERARAGLDFQPAPREDFLPTCGP